MRCLSADSVLKRSKKKCHYVFCLCVFELQEILFLFDDEKAKSTAGETFQFFVSSTEIGDIAGVADVTIRQSYRLIYPRAAELFPPDFKFDTPVDKLPQL